MVLMSNLVTALVLQAWERLALMLLCSSSTQCSIYMSMSLPTVDAIDLLFYQLSSKMYTLIISSIIQFRAERPLG